ncbi:MAG: hypothetical protein HYT87_12845 [Nitrospirae bacterium]|nr:hypothetical protein [Nitrospirota bacterium]
MGVHADIIVIGPFIHLKKEGALVYGPERYKDVPENALVIGAVAVAATSEESRLLARISNVEPWDLGNHRVLHPSAPQAGEQHEAIGDDEARVVYHRIRRLAGNPKTVMWFRPSG